MALHVVVFPLFCLPMANGNALTCRGAQGAGRYEKRNVRPTPSNGLALLWVFMSTFTCAPTNVCEDDLNVLFA